MLFKTIASSISLLFLTTLLSNSAFSANISCGKGYTVQSNDTLSSISLKAYNSPSKWNIIYLQNKKSIGNNPSIIKVKTILSIPCIDNIVFTKKEEKDNKKTPEKADNSPFNVEMVTTEWLPYIGKKLPNEGMLPHITKEVFSLLPMTSYSIDYVNDWSAHINILLKKKKYDIGLAWYHQDCSDISAVRESAKIRCEYRFSEPLYEEIITIYNKKGEGISSLLALKNKILCQPKSYLLFDYKKNDLINGENFTLIEESSINTCMEKLRDGQVQYVAINKNEGDQAVSTLGLKNEIENTSTSPVDTRSIHYIIHKSHPKAHVIITKINKALRKIRKDGTLFDIQSKHIQNFQNNL